MVTSEAAALTLYLPGPLIIALSLGSRPLAPPNREGVSQKNRLAPKLNSEDERQIGQKTTLLQHLKAIRSNLPRECLRGGKRFC